MYPLLQIDRIDQLFSKADKPKEMNFLKKYFIRKETQLADKLLLRKKHITFMTKRHETNITKATKNIEPKYNISGTSKVPDIKKIDSEPILSGM